MGPSSVEQSAAQVVTEVIFKPSRLAISGLTRGQLNRLELIKQSLEYQRDLANMDPRRMPLLKDYWAFMKPAIFQGEPANNLKVDILEPSGAVLANFINPKTEVCRLCDKFLQGRPTRDAVRSFLVSELQRLGAARHPVPGDAQGPSPPPSPTSGKRRRPEERDDSSASESEPGAFFELRGNQSLITDCVHCIHR